MLEWVPSEQKNINKEWEPLYLSFSYTHSLIGVHDWGRRSSLSVRERDCCCREIILLFSTFTFWCWFYLWGSCEVFSFMVSLRKTLCVSCLLCCAYILLLCLLFSQLKDPKIIMLAWRHKSNMVSELTWEEDIMQLWELGLPTFWIYLHCFLEKEVWVDSPL